MTFINILLIAIWKSRQALRPYGRGDMPLTGPLRADQLPISHNTVVGENSVLQLIFLDTGVLKLVVQNSFKTQLHLIKDLTHSCENTSLQNMSV